MIWGPQANYAIDLDVIQAWKFWKKQPRIRTSANSSSTFGLPSRGHPQAAAHHSHTSMDTFSTASYASEKKPRRDTLDLKSYYQSRLVGSGNGPQIIGRPSEAFPSDLEPRQTAITSLHYDRGFSQVRSLFHMAKYVP